MTINNMVERSGISYYVIERRLKAYLKAKNLYKNRLERNKNYPIEIYYIIRDKSNFRSFFNTKEYKYIGE
jgi:hypothetical protein